jgi:hypothetical protein
MLTLHQPREHGLPRRDENAGFVLSGRELVLVVMVWLARELDATWGGGRQSLPYGLRPRAGFCATPVIVRGNF